MQDFIFPFPNRDLAKQELSYDVCYSKIADHDKDRIIDEAWQKGVNAAKDIWERHKGNYDFFIITKDSGLICRKIEKDYIVGEIRYFSDYLSGQNIINLYTISISLWAKENGLTLLQAENLILSHEFFHFLECNEIGLTSKLYQVPMIKIGKCKVGKTGIKALSEIGAHAFARAYYELSL